MNMKDPRIKELEDARAAMKKNIIIFFAVIIFVTLFTVFFYLKSHSFLKNNDDFAKCLSLKGAEMYGTTTCTHCIAQKELFGSSFQYINFFDCDKTLDMCLKQGVRGYPTWIINGTKYEGKQSLEYLSYLSGCELSK
jgi:hypothetical protein